MKEYSVMRKVKQANAISLGITLPIKFVKEHNIKAGDSVVIIVGDTLRIIPLEENNVRITGLGTQ